MAGDQRVRRFVQDAFAEAGVRTDGSNPWDIRIHDERFFSRVFRQLSIGLGESYMDGWWDVERLDLLFQRLYRRNLHNRGVTWRHRLHYFQARVLNRQRPGRAFQVGRVHYDVGNDLYKVMLGPRMIYSSCYWKDATTLSQAEDAKLDLICRKLELGPGMKVLDIGCGWGGFARYAAEKYGVHVVGTTVSREQVDLARDLSQGLPIEYRLEDYRQVQGRYDRIAAIGMIGHVGYKNYRTFMQVARRCLVDDGLFLIHTMGANRSTAAAEPWIDKYVFPNGMAPSVAQVAMAIEDVFALEDWHNLSTDYYRTGMAWLANFEEGWSQLSSRYDERFRRMWRYYLSCIASSFAARILQTWDIVLSKPGGRGQYLAPR
jgi:cyclopropane-fatty-acyl-phospholipid synthase